MKKLISIIMSTYNSADFISETIASVLNQSYTNIEFIIVDDGSTDKTSEVITNFSDSRIKLITLCENQHVCAASNLAFEMAKGDYVAIIGHDDLWAERKLEKQVEFLENNQEYGVCFSWATIIDENNSVINKQEELLYQLFHETNRTREEWIARLVKGNCFCAPSAVIRRNLFSELGGYHYGLLQLQDYELWLKALLHYNVFVIPEELVYYRRFQNREMLSNNTDNIKTVRTTNEYLYIIKKFVDKIPNELFKKAFQTSFKFPDASNHEEIACEKAFFLMSMNHPSYVDNFMELINQKDTRKLLKETYQLTELGFYEASRNRLYWDDMLYEKQKQLITGYELSFKQIDANMSYLDQYIQEREKYIKQLEESLQS